MKNSNVTILGGGLAGLTLARQLKRQNANISITILEMRQKAANVAAHKVGESTVELGTHYLRDVLGLANYLEDKHLHKYGLRFFFNNNNCSIEERVEYGADKKLVVPSHQIDRGLFENDLTQMLVEQKVDIILGARVKNVHLEADNHKVNYLVNGKEETITSNWVVDASGRTSILKRQENLIKESPHDVNAVWFRVKGDIDVEDWSNDEAWKNKLDPDFRRLGTIHFMGKGYWVWFIPLSTGITSVGIVADPRFHSFSEIDTLDKCYDWLEKNESLCFKHLKDKKENVLDFKRLKHYSHDCQKFFSSEKWGLVGEAGAFLDPFYSPGTDFISMGNTWMADLILSDMKGEDIYSKSIIYDQINKKFFESWLPIYHEKYELYGNSQVMNVKISWDFAVYWAIPCLLFTNNGLTNQKVLKAIFTTKNSLGTRFGKLNQQVQQFYLDWGRKEELTFKNKSTSPTMLKQINQFHEKLIQEYHDAETLVAKLEENITVLEKMAAEIFRFVSHRINGTDLNLAVNPYTMDLNLKNEELLALSLDPNAHKPSEEIKEEINKLWLYEAAY